MSKRKRVGKVYGKSAHYWPVEMQPFWVASACIDVVLRSSEKASVIYREAKEAWGRPDCQSVLNEVTIPFSSMLAAIEAVRSNKLSDSPDPLSEIKEQYKDSIDFKARSVNSKGTRKRPEVTFSIEIRPCTSTQLEAGKRLFLRLMARAQLKDRGL